MLLAINYTIMIGNQPMQGNMILPSSLEAFSADIDAFKEHYPMASVAFYTLSSVPEQSSLPQYPLSR